MRRLSRTEKEILIEAARIRRRLRLDEMYEDLDDEFDPDDDLEPYFDEDGNPIGEDYDLLEDDYLEGDDDGLWKPEYGFYSDL